MIEVIPIFVFCSAADSSLLVWAKEYVGQCGEQFGDDLQRFLKAEDSLTEASAVVRITWPPGNSQ